MVFYHPEFSVPLWYRRTRFDYSALRRFIAANAVQEMAGRMYLICKFDLSFGSLYCLYVTRKQLRHQAESLRAK